MKIHDFKKGTDNRGICFGIVDTKTQIIGEKQVSYGLAFLTGEITTHKQSYPYARPLCVGDVVTVILEDNSLRFMINGEDFGEAFNCRGNNNYQPAIGVCGHSVHLELLDHQ